MATAIEREALRLEGRSQFGFNRRHAGSDLSVSITAPERRSAKPIFQQAC